MFNCSDILQKSIKLVQASIPQKLRSNLDIKVETKPPEADNPVTPEDRADIEHLVTKYKGSVFDDDTVGLMKIPPIHLDYDKDFQPKQPAYRIIPFFYQSRVSNLLNFLREQNVISDVDLRNSYMTV